MKIIQIFILFNIITVNADDIFGNFRDMHQVVPTDTAIDSTRTFKGLYSEKNHENHDQNHEKEEIKEYLKEHLGFILSDYMLQF